MSLTKTVLHDVEEEEKENILYGHNENMDIYFRLINTIPRVHI